MVIKLVCINRGNKAGLHISWIYIVVIKLVGYISRALTLVFLLLPRSYDLVILLNLWVQEI